MAVICEVVICLVISRAGKTKEYLSGYAGNIQHHNPWVERIEYQETYTDDKGETHTRTKVRYVTHPDRWLMELNTGRVTEISSGTYDNFCELWNTPMRVIWPPHVNCVSGGGGQLYVWDGVYENALTETYKGLYKNYISNSNSIFRTRKVTRKIAEQEGLISYPSFSLFKLEQDVVLISPKLGKDFSLPQSVQRKFQLFNAFNGQKRQIHVFLLLFDGNESLETSMRQRDWWRGGNKNEFTICLGIVPADVGGQYVVKWCKPFSWCDIPRMETSLESWYIANPGLDFDALVSWLQDNADLWKRKEFKDFKYLGTKLSTGMNIFVTLLSLALCALMCYIAVNL